MPPSWSASISAGAAAVGAGTSRPHRRGLVRLVARGLVLALVLEVVVGAVVLVAVVLVAVVLVPVLAVAGGPGHGARAGRGLRVGLQRIVVEVLLVALVLLEAVQPLRGGREHGEQPGDEHGLELSLGDVDADVVGQPRGGGAGGDRDHGR